ncbi:P-loop containing nucleoside triphosphate hydrolase protein [Talaromyces proteolyticus]|uniref:P-loop containing nucleoside triphosphate hydrolase protein n=1 Tax=Talaromyces proteolyticus TaxID=1131652 RepID=A0AAD4KI38_9EURO|nr:P-loop containing nucleoside triphosphate hydrolase protein [Talaromyces proteolyticus]KAH8692962.1 P-loop containing nucleoside triphosphate hydrolase protein [Talaromyces proteolyticus]
MDANKDYEAQCLASLLEKLGNVRESYNSLTSNSVELKATHKPLYFEDDMDLDYVDEDNADHDDMKLDLKPGFVYVGNRQYKVQDYLGEEWVEKFMITLHNIPSAAKPDCFAIEPHPWQLHGAAKLHYLCQSSFRGGICGDSMGLGKTLLAITAMELARDERESFSLVDSAPKILILDDAKTTASVLAEAKYDIIICSYHFLSNAHRRLTEFDERLALYKRGAGPLPPRPVGGLLGKFWKLLDLPVKRMVLDECQTIKREEGRFFQAVRSVYRRGTILLSGTILSNRWFDVANPIAMLSGHPFDTRSKFMNALAVTTKNTRVNAYGEPDIVSIQRLMLAFTFARPSSCLLMPGAVMNDATFELTAEELVKVTEATIRYERARASVLKEGGDSTENKKALEFAVVAQLLAAHNFLTEDSVADIPIATVELEGDPDQFLVRLTQMNSQDLGSRNRKEWLKFLDDTNISNLRNSSRVRAIILVLEHIRKTWPDEKVVIFSTFLRFLDVISRVIRRTFGDICLEFNGTLDVNAKQCVQNAFTNNPSHKYMLITSGSGGVGLNLQEGSIVLQAEVWWNRNLELQSYARCWRQGQQRTVKIFRMLATNSPIDASIKSCQTAKEKVNSTIMDVIVKEDGAALRVPVYRS